MEAAVTGRRRTTTHAEEEEAEEEEEEDGEGEEEDALVTANPAITHPALAPFRYLINEQAKSFVVLQELQNEVGALLEFRDLVMETFPHLRQKTAPRLTATAGPGSKQQQRDWEPGVRVKRKLHQLHSREQQDSLAAPRSRSNSHGKGAVKSGSSSSEAAANSGTSSAGSSAVQDSGFCADSSKEHCSTSAASSSSSAAPTRKDADDELWNLLDMIHVKGTRLRLQVEHLQQKLDKHERVSPPPAAPGLRRRSRSLELISDKKSVAADRPHHAVDCCRLSLESEMRALKQERDMLLDRIADMEAENLANVARSDRLLAELSAEKRHLQRQLRAAAANVATSSHRQLLVEQQPNDIIGVTPLTPPDYLKQEDGYRIPTRLSSTNDNQNDDYRVSPRLSSTNDQLDGFRIQQRVSTTNDTQDGFRIQSRLSSTNDTQNDDYRVPPRLSTTNDQQDGFRIPSRLSSTNDNHEDGFRIPSRLSSTNDNQDDGYRIRPIDPVSQRLLSDGGVTPPSRTGQRTGRIRVGALDGIVSSPSPRMKGARDIIPDKKKTAAILAEFNVVELQRHLLVTTFQNQIANSRIERLSRSYVDIHHQLEKFKEENDDLRFQLEEKSIELEGTRARIRLLERLQSAKFAAAAAAAAAVESSSGETLSNTLLHASHESTAILPQILPLAAAADEAANAHHSSSTESAHHDDVEAAADEKRPVSCSGNSDSPKKRPAPPPSKIPLKSYTAPKPPTAHRPPTKVATPPHSHRSNEKLSLGAGGGSRSKSRDTQQPRSRDSSSAARTASPQTGSGGRESLRRPRKSSATAQEASFSSTGSSHSTPRTLHSYSSPSLKKARDRVGAAAASAAAATASDHGGEHKQKTTSAVVKEAERLEKTEEFVDSLDNGREQSTSSNQELDRSMSSVAQSRNWRPPTTSPLSRHFFDSIDNTSSNNLLNQSLCLSAREAMADSDSLEPSCSDCGDLV